MAEAIPDETERREQSRAQGKSVDSQAHAANRGRTGGSLLRYGGSLQGQESLNDCSHRSRSDHSMITMVAIIVGSSRLYKQPVSTF